MSQVLTQCLAVKKEQKLCAEFAAWIREPKMLVKERAEYIRGWTVLPTCLGKFPCCKRCQSDQRDKGQFLCLHIQWEGRTLPFPPMYSQMLNPTYSHLTYQLWIHTWNIPFLQQTKRITTQWSSMHLPPEYYQTRDYAGNKGGGDPNPNSFPAYLVLLSLSTLSFHLALECNARHIITAYHR